ncbi:hypothetical protein P3451_22945, partial [Vibrio parahaemolyticus]|nr:hypothetical protein [Vibrio parahaemolyticus]
ERNAAYSSLLLKKNKKKLFCFSHIKSNSEKGLEADLFFLTEKLWISPLPGPPTLLATFSPVLLAPG